MSAALESSHPEPNAWRGIVADIGGTHARIALVDAEGALHAVRTLAHAAIESPVVMIRDFLEQVRTNTT